MAKENWYILSFPKGKPAWALFDGEKLVPVNEPDAKRTGTVIALIPDDFFFFVMVSASRSLRKRNIHSGLRLKMRHSFPPLLPRQERGVFRITPGEVIGYDSHPGLPDFLNTHKELIDEADVITSPFVVSFAAACNEGLSTWILNGDGNSSALVHDHELQYFRSSRQELENRLSLLELDQDQPVMELGRALEILSNHRVRLSRLRLPLNMLKGAKEFEPKFWTRVIAAIAITGLLFCAGQAIRLAKIQKTVTAYEQAIDSLYASVLGPSLGSDPFGTLLYRLEERRGDTRSGTDMLGLVSVLSSNAPGNFKIENISFTNESGTIRAIIGSYDQLETMLDKLSKVKEYNFTLKQASNTADGVLMNVRFVSNG